MLELSADALDQLVAHCVRALPHEGCGLLVGDPDAHRATMVIPTDNAARSELVYEIDPHELLVADRVAADLGLELVGAFHSHTHTEAYPSPTDVAKAVDPSWHWVVVSLRDQEPVVRSYSIRDGVIVEEPIVSAELPERADLE
jgi:proteasome lid subunit RPN8/RPN11